tara:strand:- start:6846 stop:7916 length:1071 start_codon:yes stop_codon:yes gene_type:complete
VVLIMKKSIMIVIVSLVSMIFAEGSISGVSYFGYSMNNMNANLEDDKERGFELNRVYLTYKNKISDKASFKFQADMQNKNETEKTAYYMYIKKAQFDLKVADGAKLMIGMQGMNMFNVSEKTWGNRFISQTALHMNKWSAAADLGVGAKLSMGCPFIESNKISGSLLVTNGEGYKSTSSDNNEKISFQALYGEERLDKKDGFNVGAVYSTLTYDSVEAVEDDLSSAKEGGTGTVMGGFAGFAGFGARVGLEYHMGTDLDIEDYSSSSTLMSVYANYSLSFIDGLSLFGRYDMVDLGNADDATSDINEGDEDNVSTMMAGVIYNCTDGLTFSPHIVQTAEGTGDPMMDFKVLFQLKF